MTQLSVKHIVSSKKQELMDHSYTQFLMREMIKKIIDSNPYEWQQSIKDLIEQTPDYLEQLEQPEQLFQLEQLFQPEQLEQLFQLEQPEQLFQLEQLEQEEQMEQLEQLEQLYFIQKHKPYPSL